MVATTAKSSAAETYAMPKERVSRWRTLANAWIITRREVRDSFRDWRIVAPLIILTFFFPFLAQDVAARFSNFLEGFGAELIGARTIPFLLMIVGFFPISISLVIALETFVGEKERRSLEPLLSTPLTNTELYIGKTLAAMIPPLLASFGGMFVYLLMLLSGPSLEWRPQPMLIVQIILLTVVQALVMVTGAVVVSSQTTSTRAANLLASFIIIPMTLLINGESIIMFLAPDAESPRGIGALWAIIVGMTVVVILLLRLGNSIFNREELLGRLIDQINIRGILRNLWRWARAVNDEGETAQGLVDWYRRAIPYSLKKMGPAVFIATLVFVAFFIGGVVFGLQPEWQLPIAAQTDSKLNLESLSQAILNSGVQSHFFLTIVWQNTRVLLGAALLSLFTFGVGTLVVTPATMAVLGYLFIQMMLYSERMTEFFAALLPHGIIELPIIILATAACFRHGAIVTKPPVGLSVGNALSIALGDTIKLFLGVILPGLLVAAFIEAFLTFRVVAWVIGG